MQPKTVFCPFCACSLIRSLSETTPGARLPLTVSNRPSLKECRRNLTIIWPCGREYKYKTKTCAGIGQHSRTKAGSTNIVGHDPATLTMQVEQVVHLYVDSTNSAKKCYKTAYTSYTRLYMSLLYLLECLRKRSARQHLHTVSDGCSVDSETSEDLALGYCFTGLW